MNKRISLWFLVTMLGFVGCTTSPQNSAPSQATSQGDQMPIPIVRFTPVYPVGLKNTGVTGSAEVEFVVDTVGSVVDVSVVRATHEEFGIASAVCVKNWKYTPGVHNGHLARARMRQSFNFAIEDEK